MAVPYERGIADTRQGKGRARGSVSMRDAGRDRQRLGASGSYRDLPNSPAIGSRVRRDNYGNMAFRPTPRYADFSPEVLGEKRSERAGSRRQMR